MRITYFRSIALLAFATLFASGCASPYRSDQGALWGGLGGAGVGAIIGNQTGDAGPGAAIGAAVGSLAGAAIGDEMDRMEAENRAAIEQKLGQRIQPGVVSYEQVISMTQAGVGETLIINHINSHGVVRVPTADDLIVLKQAGVSDRVVAAMQNPPPPPQAAVVHPASTPVIVEEHYYGWPRYYRPRYRHRHYHRPHRGHRWSWGVQLHN